MKAGRKWRNALPVIGFLCVALTAAMAIYTYRYEPDRYQADYTFFALPAGTREDETAPILSKMLARDCNALLNDPAFQRQVLATAQSDGYTRVYAIGEEGGHVLHVKAVGVDPSITAGLANAAGEALLAQAGDVLGATAIRKMSAAETPVKPCAPNRPVKVAGMLAGSFIVLSLLGMAFGSARVRVRWRRGRVPALLIPCLATVVDYDDRARRALKRKAASSLYEAVTPQARDHVREAALSLRSMQEHLGYSLTLTGVRQQDDSASLSVLLASELAAEGFDVLLIEMDAYAPRLRQWLGVAGEADVLDCLRDENALRAAILPTAVPKLCFIDVCHEAGFVGKLAATGAFASFLSDAAHSFDYVILNAPPCTALSDAAMLGALTDMTALAVRDGQYVTGELDAVFDGLGRVVRRLGGFILCQVPPGRVKVNGSYQSAMKG